MRFNSLLNLIGFSGKAQGGPPVSGCVTNTRMPDSPAPSQGSFRAIFNRYIPLSGGIPPRFLERREKGGREGMTSIRTEISEEAVKHPEAAGHMRENEGPGRTAGNNRRRERP